MGGIDVFVHHGGHFQRVKKTEYVGGMLTIMDFVEDYWGYFTFMAKIRNN